MIKFVAGLALIVGTAAYGAAGPATGPATTQAAAVKADVSIPEGAIEAMKKAIRQGDAKAVRASFFAPTDAEVEAADAMTEVLLAGERMRVAAVKQYGEGAARGEPFDLPGAFFRGLDNATWNIQGDRATPVQMDKRGQLGGAVKAMHRVDGAWKVDVAAMTELRNPQIRPLMMKMFKILPGMLERATKEIEAGKAGTPEEIRKRMRDEMEKAMDEVRPARGGA